MVSTFAKSRPITFVSQYDYKQGRKVDVQCPNIIKFYNSSMGDVDLADCLIELYKINIRFKKYYFCLIFHLIDIVIVNSWLLYKCDAFNLKTPESKILCLTPFKLRIANCLMQEGKVCEGTKRGRAFLQSASCNPTHKQGRPCQILPDDAVRFDAIGHWPEIKDTRKMCKIFGCRGKNVCCSKCNVNLCLNNTNNCFKKFYRA